MFVFLGEYVCVYVCYWQDTGDDDNDAGTRHIGGDGAYGWWWQCKADSLKCPLIYLGYSRIILLGEKKGLKTIDS